MVIQLFYLDKPVNQRATQKDRPEPSLCQVKASPQSGSAGFMGDLCVTPVMESAPEGGMSPERAARVFYELVSLVAVLGRAPELKINVNVGQLRKHRPQNPENQFRGLILSNFRHVPQPCCVNGSTGPGTAWDCRSDARASSRGKLIRSELELGSCGVSCTVTSPLCLLFPSPGVCRGPSCNCRSFFQKVMAKFGRASSHLPSTPPSRFGSNSYQPLYKL